MSRSTMISSAAAGMPRRPSADDDVPLVRHAVALEGGVLAVVDDRHARTCPRTRGPGASASPSRPAARRRRRRRTRRRGAPRSRPAARPSSPSRPRRSGTRAPSRRPRPRRTMNRVTLGVVVDRIGVRHAGDGGEPARRGGRQARRDRLLVLLARLAQVHVHVDEAGADHGPGRHGDDVGDTRGGWIESPLDRAMRPSTNEHVVHAVESLRGIDHPSALKQAGSCSAPPASRYSTAIRTATPLVTCSRMTEFGASATSDAISTPRFIGPGCMMITSGLASLTRSGVMPKTVKYSRSDGKNSPCIRSSWMRSIMMTSAPSRARSIDEVTRTPSRSNPIGHERRRAAHPDLGPQLRQQQHVRPQHPAVQHVADDRDLQPRDPPLPLADGERVEQRLRRVLVHRRHRR